MRLLVAFGSRRFGLLGWWQSDDPLECPLCGIASAFQFGGLWVPVVEMSVQLVGRCDLGLPWYVVLLLCQASGDLEITAVPRQLYLPVRLASISFAGSPPQPVLLSRPQPEQPP